MCVDGLDEYRACIGDYLRQKGLNTRRLFRCLAPGHEDKNPSMSFNEKAQNVHCFSCGVTYDIFDLVGMDYGLVPFPARRDKVAELFSLGGEGSSRAERGAGALPYVGSGAGGRVSGTKLAKEVAGAESVSVLTGQAAVGDEVLPDRTAELDSLMEKADGGLGYFTARGISEELCRRFGFFESGGRAYMPLFDAEGRCLGWCGRAVEADVFPRYKNSAGALPLWMCACAGGDAPAGNPGITQTEQGVRTSNPDAPCNACAGGDAPAGNPRITQTEQGARGDAPAGNPGMTQTEQGVRTSNPDALSGAGALSGGDAPIYITEGILDAASLVACGRRAVALCGSQNTRKLLVLAAQQGHRAGMRFIAAGDGDEAGRRMNAALTEGLRALHITCGELSLPDGADINALLLADRRALCERLAVCEAASEGVSQALIEEYKNSSVLNVLDVFFANAARRAGVSGISTGLPKLDDALDGGLYPGLIVLGAPSSLGKTSLMLQIADAIAENGRDVLYFSLEMSRFELIAKSISRITAQLDDPAMRRAVPARDLLRGSTSADAQQELLVRRARAEYASFAQRIYIREGLADIGAQDIRTVVEMHIERCKERPVVFVDYLQILRAGDQRATDKQNTDRSVVELKRISRDYDVPVVVVSSFNRESYRTAAAMESFKESGAVEYSSDVLLALQLAGTGESGFDANTEKLRDPRRLELVMLKNRSGAPYAKLKLEYHARVGLFR